MLKLGGMENKSPKTEQTTGRFRVARNVMPTSEGTLIPRYDWTTPATQLADTKAIHNIANYEGEPLEFASTGGSYAGNKVIAFAKSGVTVPFGPLGTIKSPMGNSSASGYSQLPISLRINNTMYILTPSDGRLRKYDGVQVTDAGNGSLNLYTNGYSAGGTRFIRFVKHLMDFDNNEPVSDYLQFPVLNTPFSVNTASGATPGGYNSFPDNSSSGVIPSIPYPVNSTAYSDCFVGTAAYDAINSELDITETTPSAMPLGIGSYVTVFHNQTQMIAAGYYDNERALALKVKSIFPLVLDVNASKVLGNNRVWRTETLVDPAGVAPLISYGANYYLTVWEGTSATGIYYYRSCIPYFNEVISPANIAPYNQTITTTGAAIATAGSDKLMFTIGPALNDWYDTTSIKISPNANYDFGSTNFHAMTKYQGSLLLANEDYIWFSDTTLGGWVDQLNTQNSLLIGDKEHGRITAICGTSDFLFVGRERKNYYVSGNISTGNYSVQEIENAPIGPWCNQSAINVKNTVIFLTVKGIYQLGVGGNAVDIGDRISKNFNTFNFLNTTEDIVFEMTGTVSNMSYDGTALGLSVAYDPFRELLVFMKRSASNPCLVVSTKDGEIFEWDGMNVGSTHIQAECIQFINGKYYLGEIDTSISPYTKTATYNVETLSLTRSYANTYPIKLYTTWITAEEPSLEKELLQIKMFGRIATDTGTYLKVRHYKDWNLNNLITDALYASQVLGNINTQVQFSHKKRFNSDKCLAASIGIEIQDSTTDFELESFEIEFNPIQVGVKR